MKPAYQHPFEASEALLRQHEQVNQRLLGGVHESLQCRLELRQRLLEQIQERLALNPDDQHQHFIFELHQQAYHELLAELKLVNLERSARYGDLDGLVNQYLEDWQDEAEEEQDPEQDVQQALLLHQQKTWQEMIDKVRERLRKRPADPLLMRLLAEHQARLLALQEQSHQLQGAKLDEWVLEKVDQQNPALPVADEPAAANDPEDEVDLSQRLQLEREIVILTGMIAKTELRLEAKPGLKHLKDLIVQHQQRVGELQDQLRGLS